MKLALHWQIVIALILATIAGIFLPPYYKVTDSSFTKLNSDKQFQEKLVAFEQKELLNEIKKLGNDSYSEKDFEKSLEKNSSANHQKVLFKKIEKLENKSFKTDKEFQKELEKIIGKKESKVYAKHIKNSAKVEPVHYISWMGDIFLRALKMIIVPLILSSIISGIANLGGEDNLGRLGGKTLLYYLSTSVFAITTGLVFVNLIAPGIGAPTKSAGMVEGLEEATGSFGATLMNMIPTNVFESLSTGKMLSIIFFAIIFGYFITKVKDEYSELLKDFFNAVFEVMMKITMFIIKFTALGVFGLVAGVVAEQAGDSEALSAMAGSLGLYMLTVILALGFHFFVSLPLIMYFIGKVNPFAHLRNMTNPLLTAFSTSSSSATLPLTMETVENKSGVSNKVTSFTLPLGATINMDGTALYECVAAMFIAQAYGFDLSLGQQVIVVITALLASVGAAGIPMAGLVMISVILTAVGLPLEGIGMILAVDRVLDMMRTTTNVWSDSCGAVIIAKSEGEELKV